MASCQPEKAKKFFVALGRYLPEDFQKFALNGRLIVREYIRQGNAKGLPAHLVCQELGAIAHLLSAVDGGRVNPDKLAKGFL